MNPAIEDAAAGVLVHEERVLMVRRRESLAAFPGYWAFPGGKVDDIDRLPEDSGDLAAQRALAREVQEEVGIDLPGLLADHLVADMAAIGHATTPSFIPRRFATHFYRVDLRTAPELQLEAEEITEAQWRHPREWLAEWRQGRLLCAPPTLAVLHALAEDPAAQEAPELAEGFEDVDRFAAVAPIGGLHLLAVPSNTIPPAQHTNCLYIEDADQGLLIDPSPAGEKHYAKLRDTIADWPLAAILLTHHHPDHREGANRLARERGVPMLCSADTRARIIARDGEAWFEGLDVRTVGEGDVVGRWQGEPVRVIAVPGHDAGQLAPMPESRAWCLVSDLIQGVGTVVVGGDEGDMSAYFASLSRVIALDPAVIIPSHGPAVGGTHRLRETLAHRQMREQQVLEMHSAGADVEAMLERIYGGSTPDFLMPLARINIEAHLDKLRAEGRLAA